jgi:DNA-binding response OmpR family regulator
LSGVVSPSRTRILVVEDDPATRVLYSSALKNAGYSVAAVEDGVDALKTFDVGRIPDAVVLDLGLPRLSGHDVMREMWAHPQMQRVPILVVTGLDVDGLGLRSFDCVLKKPVSVHALVEAMEGCLNRSAGR